MNETASRPSTRRFSVAQLVLLIPWVALVIDAWSPIRDNSFLWHIRAGELQIEAGSVLTQDPFSFTRLGETWLTQSWLAELFYRWGEVFSGGLGFVPPMMLALSTVTFACIGLVAYRRSKSITSTAIVLLLSVVLMISFLVPRPVAFSFALFGLTLVAWETPVARWALPFIFWIWASMHGSFAIGLGYVGLMLIAEKEWKWLPTAVVSGLVTLLTAHGMGVVRMLLDFADARQTLSLLSEWQRPQLTSPVFAPFVIGLALILIALVRRRMSLLYLVPAVPFALLASTALRAVPPAWLGIVPLVAHSLGRGRVGEGKRISVVPAVFFAGVVVVLPFLVRGDGGLSETRFPVAAAQRLLDVRTFHDDRAGGYLIWSMGPDFKVYLDDRAELYGERMAEFVAVRDGDSPWQPVFERDGIEQVLLPAGSELATSIEGEGWSTVYEDADFVVLRP
ncbi:MAG: hypothetical protein WCE80_03255 [Acidimicrobiia bacterium]